jgi:hypothetical protein
VPRAATPDAEAQRRARISAAMRGRLPAGHAFSHTPSANAARGASLRAYWQAATERRATMPDRARELAAIREARKVERIERVFAAALRRIKARYYLPPLAPPGGSIVPAPRAEQ